jgi:hypothetical protein
VGEFIRYIGFFVAGFSGGAFLYDRSPLWPVIAFGCMALVWLYRPSTDAQVRQ